MRHKWVLALSALLVWGCDRRPQFEPPPPPLVTVERPLRQLVTPTREFIGRTEAREFVEVRARVPGILKEVAFSEGDLIEPGQVLFALERDSYEAGVAAAQADVDRNKAVYDLAEIRRARLRTAFETGAAGALEMEQAIAEAAQAKANWDAALASLRMAEIDLGYTRIEAPIGGRASRSLVSVGNLVGAGESTLLTTIVQDDPIEVYFDIDERLLLDFLRRTSRDERAARRGTVRVRLVLADGQPYPHEGVIDFAENVADASTGTIRVRAVFPNPAGALFGGIFARVIVPEEPIDAMLVPVQAVQRDLIGPYVLIVGENDEVERRNVVLGTRWNSYHAVLSGLSGDERVIVGGVQRARPGIAVRVKDSPEPVGPDGARESRGDRSAEPSNG